MSKKQSLTSRLTSNAALVRNLLLTRTAWLRKLLDPRRDIDAECGHPESIPIADYSRFYKRGDIAKRIVNIYPEESWSESPAVLENEDENETEFEKRWKELEDEFRVWHYLQRADILSGIGRFGVLLLGVDDGLPLSEPVEVGRERKLLYLRPFEEEFVTVSSLVGDQSNERYGLPEKYAIQFADTALTQQPGEGTSTQIKTGEQTTVHHTRVIHLADNRLNSDVYGLPRMEVVFNRLLDLRKITGGSGEMFWKGGFPGISLEAANPDDDVEFDATATQEQMDKYMNGLQRYIALVGMSAKSLAPQVADPSKHVEVQLKLIATALSVPWRVFIGSEQGVLASNQDSVAWNKRINRRREEYINPFIIQPFIEKLQELQILPEVEKYVVKWPDLNSPSDDERASIAEKRTNALAKYVQTGMDALIPPFQYLTLVLDFSDEEAQGILNDAGDRIDELTPEFAAEQKQIEADQALERTKVQAEAQAKMAAKMPAPAARAPFQR